MKRDELRKEYAAKGTGSMPLATNYAKWLEDKILSLQQEEGVSEEWISVDDRLPVTLVDVLVSCGGTAVNIGYYNKDAKVWYYQYNKENWTQNITYWKPLTPPPPESEKKSTSNYFTNRIDAMNEQLSESEKGQVTEEEIKEIIDENITTIHDHYFEQDCKRAAKAIIQKLK